MANSTVDELFALIEKSRLLTPEQMEQARRTADGQDRDASAICDELVRQNLITRWQAGQLLSGRWSFFLGKYRLLDLLGRGGMGSVFLGEHVTMNRRVALKVLSKQVGKEPGSLDKFLAEARLIASLDHSNIVHAFSVDCEGDRYYLVMEYVDGSDLQKIVEKDGPMEFGRAVDCIRQAAEGLAHAHRGHVVHCDIKPSNLLLTEQGTIKVLDMGVARLVGPGSEAGKPDESVLGSVDYLAPEQALASPSFDHRADIYSLGCTFYFLLTGRPPFPEGSLAQRIMKHQTKAPREIAQLRKDVPKELVAICSRMMMKNPDDRYQSAEEVSRSLSAWRGTATTKPKSKPAALPPKRGAAKDELREQTVAAESLEDMLGLAEAATMPGKRAATVGKVDKTEAPATKSTKLAEATQATKGVAVPKKKKRAGRSLTPRAKRNALLIAAGGVLLVLAGIGGAWMMMSKPKNVANATADAAKLADSSETKVESKPKPAKPALDADALKDLFSPEANGMKSAEEEPSAESPPEPQDTAGSKTPPKPGDDTKSDPKKPGDKKNDPKKPDLAAAAPASGDPKANPPAEPPQKDESIGELTRQENPKPAPKPDPKPAAKPVPKPGDKQPPKPDPKQPAKPEPAKKGNTFQGVADAVDLPKVPRDAEGDGRVGDPISLGTVSLEPNTPLGIELVGGKTAVRGNIQFDMEPRADGESQSWVIHCEAKESGAGSADRTNIGEISLADDRLQFQWLGGAGKVKAANLHNCGLKLSASGASKWLALNRPATLEPLVLDLDKGIKNVKIPLEAMGDPSQLRLQVTGVEGVPKSEYSPGDTMNLQATDKEKPILWIGFDHEKTKIALELKCNLKATSADVTLRAFAATPDQPPILLSTKSMTGAFGGVQARLQQMEATLKAPLPPNIPDEAKKRWEEGKKNLEAQKNALAGIVPKMQAIETARQKLHNTVKVKYRVYFLCDEEKIEMAVSQSAAPVAGGAFDTGKKGPFGDPGASQGPATGGPPSKKKF